MVFPSDHAMMVPRILTPRQLLLQPVIEPMFSDSNITALNCTLCDGNYTATKPLEFFNMTCGSYAEDLASINDSSLCAEGNNPYIEYLCDCPKPESSCQICDGKFDPSISFPEVDMTCGQMAAYVAFETNSTKCEAEHNNIQVQALCGCPKPESSCQICDGKFDPSIFIPEANMTCGQMAAYVAFETNSTKCEAEHNNIFIRTLCGCPSVKNACDPCEGKFTAENIFNEEEELTCGAVNMMAGKISKESKECRDISFSMDLKEKCDCPVAEVNCTVCNGHMPDPNLVISPDGFNCSAGAEYAKSQATSQGQCKEYQAVIGAACNCKDVPTPSCDVLDKCPQGKQFNPLLKYGQDISCGQAALYGSLGNFGCDKNEIMMKCCDGNETISNTSFAPSTTPSNNESTSKNVRPNTIFFGVIFFILVSIW
jgi:hypothetical protein